MSWSTSNRRARLPSNWSVLRAFVLQRDPVCKIRGPKCAYWSTEADHIAHGDNHALTNLQGVCRECHASKSGSEGGTARAQRYSRKYPRR